MIPMMKGTKTLGLPQIDVFFLCCLNMDENWMIQAEDNQNLNNEKYNLK